MVFKKKIPFKCGPSRKMKKNCIAREFHKGKKSTPDQVCAIVGTVVITLLKFLSWCYPLNEVDGTINKTIAYLENIITDEINNNSKRLSLSYGRYGSYDSINISFAILPLKEVEQNSSPRNVISKEINTRPNLYYARCGIQDFWKISF